MKSKDSFGENVTYPAFMAEIQAMYDVDQAMREKNLADEDFWDDEVDRKNTEGMKKIIEKIGFPTISKVGKVGMRNAWYLIQHADHDVEFQKMCLGLISKLPNSEVDKTLVAYLEDRVRVNEKRGQLYGTQFTQIGNQHVPRPIEDEEHVDERRAQMGMGPLADQIRMMYEKYPFSESE